MTELKTGQLVEVEYGGFAKILNVIGSGGQGTVYLVDFNGNKMALKWYDIHKIKRLREFRRNIKKNINDGSPSDKFLWPKYLTKSLPDGQFGYLMELKPECFDSLVDILATRKVYTDPVTGRISQVPVRFKNLYSMVTSLINISNAFRQLHRAGKSYQDLNDGGFFINVNNGDVLVCDCDNIAPDGKNFGIGGKPGYIAPEITRGIARPNVQTDKYSLAVVFFKLLFRGEPMEGKKVINNLCLPQNAPFVYDPDDSSNRPVKGIHDNVINFWKLYPDYIRNAFILSFTKGVKNPNSRIIENEWQKLFIRLRSEIITCRCGKSDFASMYQKLNEKVYRCPQCGTTFTSLKISSCPYRIPLYIGSKLYKCEIYPDSDDFTEITGEIIENSITPGLLGIKNCSGKTWIAKMPDNIFYHIPSGKGFPIWEGLEINFGKNIKASI
ncbi:MAG: serine/threonine-protein kinase [Oscillospiraceae bacterium]|nr:serine/threonine-protein kinase [Oscillospiraceae bacterium]